jgi:hypothetical protein
LIATYTASSSSEFEPVCKRQVCSSTASSRPELGDVRSAMIASGACMSSLAW